MATDAWGIDDGWHDTSGSWRPAPGETVERIRSAMFDGNSGPRDARPVWVVRPGQEEHLLNRCQLVLEDGDDLGEIDHLPRDLPLGIHDLTPLDHGPTTTLIVSPRRCHLPPDLRTWGVTMQVPTSRSRSSWGIGDLADVRSVAEWVHDLGGGAIGLSPLHSPTPVAPVQPSPYYPSSRRWRSPLLLRIEDVPGADHSDEIAALAAEARGLLADRVVDRDRCWALKRRALEHLWTLVSDRRRGDLQRWRSAQGEALEGWARFCALSEVHGAGWSTWPAELHQPASPAVAEVVAKLEDRVAFHAWLQLLIEEQLRGAQVEGVRVIQDLAIGVDPDGADAWLMQDLLALDMSVGAPPDDFASDGQSWGLPPFIPWRLRDAGYRPLAELLRASMTDGGGLRVDHVMGLSRLFWIPEGASPAEGTYVRFAGRELLDVLAMESARAGAIVVGEDLGTVEPSFRQELHDTRVLSTRLVWFEDVPPEQYPSEALAMATTHDLPTIAGVWTGADDAEQKELGRDAHEEATARIRSRLEAITRQAADTGAAEVTAAVHERLGHSPAQIVLATLEDVCGVASRPNIPGTTAAERSNWSVALPLSVDDLPADPTAAESLDGLARARPR